MFALNLAFQHDPQNAATAAMHSRLHRAGMRWECRTIVEMSSYPPKNDSPVDDARPSAVLCLSGGMDSAVCAALAARDYKTYALHFSYGQRTEGRELRAARAVAEAIGVRQFMNLNVDIFRRIGGSALTDLSIDVPQASEDSSQSRSFGGCDPSHLRALPQCTFSFRCSQLGRGRRCGGGVHRGSRARQLRLS